MGNYLSDIDWARRNFDKTSHLWDRRNASRQEAYDNFLSDPCFTKSDYESAERAANERFEREIAELRKRDGETKEHGGQQVSAELERDGGAG